MALSVKFGFCLPLEGCTSRNHCCDIRNSCMVQEMARSVSPFSFLKILDDSSISLLGRNRWTSKDICVMDLSISRWWRNPGIHPTRNCRECLTCWLGRPSSNRYNRKGYSLLTWLEIHRYCSSSWKRTIYAPSLVCILAFPWCKGRLSDDMYHFVPYTHQFAGVPLFTVYHLNMDRVFNIICQATKRTLIAKHQ